MQIERAIYSSSAVNEAIRQTKAINATVNHKNEHFAKSQEIKKVYEYCEENVNRFLFSYDYSYIKDYCRAAYNFKQYTKKELDQLERYAIRYLQNELTGIKTMMITGEVDTTD